MESDVFAYHAFLESISTTSLEKVRQKDKEYGASWKKRGGSNAFAMLCRKWDRLEEALTPKGDVAVAPLSQTIGAEIPAYDILRAGELDTREEGIMDDIRDLRNYLLLVEAEIAHRRYQKQNATMFEVLKKA